MSDSHNCKHKKHKKEQQNTVPYCETGQSSLHYRKKIRFILILYSRFICRNFLPPVPRSMCLTRLRALKYGLAIVRNQNACKKNQSRTEEHGCTGRRETLRDVPNIPIYKCCGFQRQWFMGVWLSNVCFYMVVTISVCFHKAVVFTYMLL